MNIDQPLTLLGGISAHEFMQTYWQRKPLLIRGAIPNFKHSLSIDNIRELVTREEVESRLIIHDGEDWEMETGPFDELPPASQPNWTALAQSVDLHDDNTAALMRQFRFIGDARLDDAMISIASDGGGVGPHFDSYDVFLLQAHGKRHWRISQQKDLSLVPDLPLKILRDFQVEEEFILEPGDMLYLPPHVAHDGIAIGDCMTISIGFRSPTQATLARGLMDAASDQLAAASGEGFGLYADPPMSMPEAMQQRYTDPDAQASTTPAALPENLIQKSLDALNAIRFDEALASRFLGVWLTELPSNSWFDIAEDPVDLHDPELPEGRLALDRCSRMMYRGDELYINGEVAPCPASPTLKLLADQRELLIPGDSFEALDEDEREMLNAWLDDGWLQFKEN
ncbi:MULTISPECIES: JmjC domain-containing protein [Alcaligenes]|uniref:JmjC domain-containing protein n=1 Tax=Alcaligenes TaxID=507 RepID=UPI0005AB2C8D|nr:MULTISPECIES: cupin domain-containing protein [Alcaligenes]ATH98843.1 cupin domain-containing protein [Alcaligenes faecalis]AYZ91629.1 cupin domain-containing protein [Alcaligenes faecalis]MCX5594186.1 cupin domain-containing protein [Alcaligenes faecalis]MDT0218758.1 cupin domain-containing protein [Alcaligenes sp. AB3]QQC32550.1 cupin domain-containing protein [Alcaligenes faecalis]